MSIVSFWFYIFFIISVILYYCIPKKVQWPFLLIISLIFLYSNSTIKLILLFFLIVLVAWFGAIFIEKSREKYRRLVCVTFIGILVGVLFYCKDREFINTVKHLWNSIFGNIGYQLDYHIYPIIGLIGMSYFTLSLIGYILDVYWGKYHAERNYLKVLLFAGYFPQLTSGPINRFDELSQELFTRKGFNPDAIIFGAERIIWGCIKKLVIADRAAIYVAYAFDFDEARGIWVLGGIFLYALQLYADFSGSMDIVLGVSECFQIRMPENFKTPFASRTFAEFWRRWHITMGTWFKDYLLYPILKSNWFQKFNQFARNKFGKKYGKKLATSVGLSILWLTIGLWHGGNSTYIIASGIIPGTFLVLGLFFEDALISIRNTLHIDIDSIAYKQYSSVKLLLMMSCSWIVLRAGGVRNALEVIKKMMDTGARSNLFHVRGWYCVIRDNSNGLSGLWLFARVFIDCILILWGFLMLVYVGNKNEKGIIIRKEISKKPIAIRWLILIIAMFLIILFGIYGPGYDATDFIYKEF